MEETEVVSRIAGVYAKMSQSQLRIADVILHDLEGAAFLNVAELARAANVSDSSVTRFAIFLGYSGYPALSQELQARVRMRLTTRERLERSRLGDDRDPEAIYYTSIADDLDNMNLPKCAVKPLHSGMGISGAGGVGPDAPKTPVIMTAYRGS